MDEKYVVYGNYINNSCGIMFLQKGFCDKHLYKFVPMVNVY